MPTNNPYMALAEEDISGSLPVNEYSPANPYMDVADEDKTNINSGMKRALYVAGNTTPQAAGEVQRLSKKTSMPEEAVKFEMDEAKKRARQIEAEELKLTASSPILARQLNDVSFAEIAQNNLPELSRTESMIKWFTETVPSDISIGTEEGTLQNQQSNLKYKMMAGIATPEDVARIDEIENQLKGMRGSGGAWEKAFKVVGQNLDNAPEAIKRGLQMATAMGMIGAAAGGVGAGPMAALGFGIGTLHEMLYNTYRVEGAEVYKKLLDEGVSHKSAQWAGLGVGIVNAALEGAGIKVASMALAPAKKLLAGLVTQKLAPVLTRPSFEMAAKEFGKSYALHVGGENLTEGLQEVSAIIGEDIARVYGAGFQSKFSTVEGREEIANRLAEVFVDTTQAMSILGAIGPLGVLGHRTYQMRQATKQTQFLEGITKVAADSETRKLNPDKYEEFAHAQTVNTPAENIYVDGNAFKETLRQLGTNVDEVAKIIPDIKEQLNDAINTDGDVIIPTAKYLAHVAGTGLGNSLMQHIRLDPDALSAAEHRVMEQNKQEMQEEAKAVIAKNDRVDQTFAQSASQVEKTMFDQLVAAAMPASNARANAQIVRDMYVVAASKMNMMPHQLYELIPYNVRSGTIEEQSNPVQMFEQARKKAQLEINHTVDELVSAADSQSNWKDWYKQHQAALDKLFGSDSALFQKILSATSQAASVKANVGLALKAYDQYLSGAEFTGYLPAVIGNLNRIRADEALTGQKISQYGEANEGNVDAIAVDRHIAMLFFDTKSPSPAQVEIAKQRIREVAERLGWEPRQVQAALWAFNQVRLGSDPNEVVSYDKVLERKADLIAALRTRHGRGKGGGVQIGSNAVQRSETGFGSEPDGTVFHQQGVTAQEQAETTAKIEETRAIESTLEAEGATDVKPILADQLMEDKSIPTISIEDILGITMFPTIADRTAAGALFHGIDSSKLQLAIHLLGGPFFPLRETNVKANVIYANRGKSVISQKNRRLKEGANYMLIMLGDVNMHQSNTTVANTFFATLEAYVRDGRISEENMQALTDMVRNSKTKAKKINAYMQAFPYIGNIQELDDYIHTLSFEARSRLLDLLGSKAALDAGAPSMKKILDATRQPELAGNRWGDGVVLVKLDTEKPFVNLGEEGTMPHPDFPLGMRGEVVGKLRTPLNYELLWQNWLDTFKNNKSDFFDIMTSPEMTSLATWSERAEAFKKFAANSKNKISPTVRKLVLDEIKTQSKVTKNKPEGINPSEYDAALIKDGIQEDGTVNMETAKQAYLESTNSRRAFEMAKPALTITPDLVERLKDIDVPNIDGQRQAQLAVDMALGQWGRSGIPVNKGGVSPQAFVDAVKNSDAVATLDEYNIDDVKQGIKEKTLRLFQLGDKTSGIWFALKDGNPATGYGLEIAGLSDKDVTLTAVINNEQGARGIAAPAVVLKAIEEGASVLDAFAVRSSKFPNGFLPELYSLFGFEVVGELPFDPQYYTAQKLADAEAFWSKGGWNKETDGYPPVVIMKWMGTDAERKGITERYLRDGIEGLFEGRTSGNVEEFVTEFGLSDRKAAEAGGATTDTGRAGGDQRTRNRSSLASRAQSIARSIGELSDLEAANLGISTADRDAVRNLLDSGTLYNQLEVEPAAEGIPAGTNSEFAKGTRGAFNPKTLTTLLYEKADFSTFMHETFHFGLEFYVRLAQMEGGAQVIKNDLDTVFQWMGIAGETPEARLQTWLGMSVDEQRKHHEAFAYNGEIYLFEGKAPSVKLQDVFNKFFDFLRRIYVSIRDDLNAIYRKENGQDLPIMTGEVKDVMDRMLATENQIRQAEAVRDMMPLFQTQEQSGMDNDAWSAYQVMAKEAHDQSVQDMTASSLRQMRWLSNAKGRVLKEMQRETAAQRAEMREIVADEVSNRPVYQADRFIRRGELTLPEGATQEQRRFATETGLGSTKLSIPDLIEMYGKEGNAIWRNLPTGKYGLMAQEGLHPDVVAAQFGFSSGDQMIRELLAAAPMKEAIETATDQRMLETYGELQTQKQTDIAIERALHNEARARFAAIELRSLAKALVPVRVMMMAAKQVAIGILENKKILEIKPNQYSASESKSMRAAAGAMKKGQTMLAIKALQSRLLNNQLAAEAIKTNQEIAKSIEMMRNTQTPAAKKRIGADNSDQIQSMLARFGLAPVPQERASGRVSLAEWMKQQEDAGRVPDIAPDLLIETHSVPYDQLTVREFRDLADAIKQIAYMGREEQKMLTAAKSVTFKEARDEIVASINENAGDRQVTSRTPSTMTGRMGQSIKRFWAAHIKAASIAKILDGGKDNGPMWQYFIRTANERGDMETRMRSDATMALTEIMDPVLKMGKMSGSGTYFPSIKRSMNREQVMAIALNMGNEGNMQRLLGGEGWTLKQVMPVVQSLTETELRTVQKIWDYLETFRPQIAEKERRLYGKEPKWIEPQPIQITSAEGTQVDLKGGYYPIKYDPMASLGGEKMYDAEAAKRELQGAYTSATTKRSFTKERVKEVLGQPLLYSLSAAYTGINDVIHDLAWHEWLIDVNRLLRSTSIDKAIRDHYGPEFKTQLKNWVKDIAEGERRMQNDGEIALGFLRRNISAAGLGFNVMSAIQQITGFNQSIVLIGVGNTVRGISRTLSEPNAFAKVNEMSEFMAARSRTQFRELNEIRNQVEGKSGVMNAIHEGAYYMMMQMQRTVDVPTWYGAYEKYIGEGHDEKTAVALADQVVIDSQGSGLLKDMAQVQRGSAALKLFTVFYDYMGTMFNLAAVKTMTEKSKAKLAADYLMIFVVPVVLNHAIKAALTPSADGSDDNKKLAKELIAEQISYLMGGMIIVREFADAGRTVIGVDAHGRDYAGPAGLRLITNAYRFAKQAAQGQFDDAFRKAAIDTIGTTLGMPSAQVNRSITGYQALKEGRTKNPAALILGYEKPK